MTAPRPRARTAAIQPSGPLRHAFIPLTACVLAGMLLYSPPAAAQVTGGQPLFTQMSTGVGWTGVVPDALLGAGVFQMLGGSGWGLYADGKMTHDRPSSRNGFLEGETVATITAQYPDHIRGPERAEWLFLNLGIIRELTPQFALFGAGGVARHSVTREYFDPNAPGERITPSGIYYVENDRASLGWGATGMGGFLLRIGEPIVISAGFESNSQSITLGGFWVIR